MNCNSCKHLGSYTTGADEYPPCASLPKCNKGHFHDAPGMELEEENDCKDFEDRHPFYPKPYDFFALTHGKPIDMSYDDWKASCGFNADLHSKETDFAD